MTSTTNHYAIGDVASKPDPGRRVQWLRTAADVEASGFSEEEKAALAAFLDANESYDLEELPDHSALKRREPVMAILQRDPQLAGILVQAYIPLAEQVTGLTTEQVGRATTHAAGIHGVTDDPEKIHNFEIAMLFVYAVAYENRDEWTLRLMATMPDLLNAEKCIMLGHPESSVWSDEERAVLQLTHALITGDVSDELFNRAQALWGLQRLIRYTAWVGNYETTMMLSKLNVSDVDKRAALRSETGS